MRVFRCKTNCSQATPVLDPMFVPESDRGEGTMLYVSNLDYGVTNQDLKLLFSEVGELKRYSINYDKSGRSKGTGEVVYARRTDAITAINKYNNLQLDGKPLRLEMIGVKMQAVSPPPIFPPPYHPFWRTGAESVGASLHSRGGGTGRGQAPGQRQKKSVEELDAELDLYRFEAMKLK
ncbi:THO complex subunit 4A [Linum grandiflorum]